MLRKLMIAIGAGLLLGGMGLAQGPAFGSWTGLIGPEVLDLGVNVVLDGTEEEPVGILDIPVQGLYDFALSDVEVDGTDVTFAMPGVPGNPVFTGSVEGDTMSGTFSQGGQDFEFLLERSDELPGAHSRPQEPEEPFPYLQEEVTVVSPAGDVTLAGTLSLPEGDGPHTALLFVTGSGPQDRDSFVFGHRPFLVLSDALVRAGYATLRLDDRGVGGSDGADHLASYADLTADGVAAVEFLAQRADIAEIGIIGHSQGGYLAPAIAAESDTDFIINLAGPAVGGLEVLELQNALIIEMSAPAGTPQEQIDYAVESQLTFLRHLNEFFVAGDLEGAEEFVRGIITPQLAATGLSGDELEEAVQIQLLASVTPSMASFVSFDPQPLLRELTIPILTVYGGLDVQVPARQSLDPLSEALEAAGNPDHTVLVIEDMNHILQPGETGNPEEYTLIETTIHAELFDALFDWLGERY